MNAVERGAKHTCSDCAGKYYDLGKKDANCPKCGGKPLVAKMPRSTRPARKSGATPFRRYP
jgi:hypothetical protein